MRKTKVKTKLVYLGKVDVDSGQLVICDPSYIDEDFSKESGETGHPVLQHKEDKSLWQFTNGQPSKLPYVNAFPGRYDIVIPKYGKSPNDLIESKEFIKTNLDTMPSVKEASLTYEGIRKALGNDNHQLKHKMGHDGAGVAFNPGFGDGSYKVYAEIGAYNEWGERVKRVIIECIDKNDEG